MSIPPLRQPKFITEVSEKSKNATTKPVFYEPKFVILTLRDNQKLVVNSDAYNGILMMEDKYSCVFCNVDMDLDNSYKEVHVNSPKHIKALDLLPYVEEFADNLVRKIQDCFYCTICHAVITTQFLSRHTNTEIHRHELEKAGIRAFSYKPVD